MTVHTAKLLPQALDEISRNDPLRVFADFLDPPHIDVDCLTVTYGEFAEAVNSLCWWLQDCKKHHDLSEFDTIAYVGFPDMRYYFLLVACMKCRLKVLFSSPTNSSTMHRLLMDEAGCKLLLLTQELPLQELKDLTNATKYVPSVKSLLASENTEVYPYNKTFAEACNDPVVYFHSSGSTGRPKVRLWTNMHMSNASLRHELPEFDGTGLLPIYRQASRPGGLRSMPGVAIFHGGMAAALQSSIFDGKMNVFPPFHIPPSKVTTAQLKSWLLRGRPDHLTMFPAKLDLALQDSDYFDLLCQVSHLGYIGAPLGYELGSKLSQHTQISPGWGSTEISFLPSYAVSPEDWQYVKFDSPSLGVEWRPYDGNMFEMVFVRDDSLQRPPQYIFSTFPDLHEYATGDLFTPHPTKRHLWRFEQRVDETVILSISQNVNPLVMEREINQHSKIKSATILGNNRSRPCLVLELNDDNGTDADIDSLWPFIEGVLSTKSQYERFGRSDVILADARRPLPRGMKGTVIRSQVYSLYENEIYKDPTYTK